MSTAELRQIVERLALSQRETDRQMQETDRKMQETDRKIRELSGMSCSKRELRPWPSK